MVRMMKRRREIPPKQYVKVNLIPCLLIFTGKKWSKKLLNITMDFFSGVSGSPLLKIDLKGLDCIILSIILLPSSRAPFSAEK